MRNFAARSLLVAAVVTAGPLLATDPVTLENVEPPPPLAADEPLVEAFSLEKAARYLDIASLDWQKRRNCATCHTNVSYLLARPALRDISPEPVEVRAFFDELVGERWPQKERLPDAEVVATATALAWHDRSTEGRLSPTARTALDRLCERQQSDGSWPWMKCGWPPMESDDHYGVTFAAVGLGVAPDGYAESEKGRKALAGIRGFLSSHPAPSLHHETMVLWASCHVDGILTDGEKKRTLDALFARQGEDGGWAIAALLADWEAHTRKDDEPQDTTSSDGYATGLAVLVAREAGVAAVDERLTRAVAWLKSNQRESGRWFTRSPTRNSKHFLSHAGTAYAILALDACGEISAASAGVER